MRALLATAGLLVLAGAATAATPEARTLSRATNGPIEAVAQDGRAVAWLVGDDRRCNALHLMTPGGTELLPQPAADSMTCHWDVAAGQTQLAVAAHSSSVLWTLHEDGDTPFDYVMTAKAGGPETRVDRVAHASDGTGTWLGGVAGSGTTLAYSSVEVDYVDKMGCLSGVSSCRRHISGGGIEVVSGGHASTLGETGPALQLAASAGRIAYVPAVKLGPDGAPAAGPRGAIGIISALGGITVCTVQPRGLPLAIALSPRILAVLTLRGRAERISWYDAQAGTQLGSVRVSRRIVPQLAASNRLVVFRVGRLLRGIVFRSAHLRTLAKTAGSVFGLSLDRGRLVWAEDHGSRGRLRSLAVG